MRLPAVPAEAPPTAPPLRGSRRSVPGSPGPPCRAPAPPAAGGGGGAASDGGFAWGGSLVNAAGGCFFAGFSPSGAIRPGGAFGFVSGFGRPPAGLGAGARGGGFFGGSDGGSSGGGGGGASLGGTIATGGGFCL